MGDPLISVVLPTHNRAYCVCRAVDSALAQTYGNIEVLIIDDGSSDGTGEVIKKRYGSDARVRYHWKTNGGAGTARNEGIARAAGEWIAFLDSDDQWKPGKLELQMQCARRFPEVGLIWTDMDAVGPDGDVVKSKYISDFYGCYKQLKLREIFSAAVPLYEIVGERRAELVGETLYWGDVFPSMFLGNLVHTSTAMLRREVATNVPGFNPAFGQWGEDYDFFLRCTGETKAGFLSMPTILYQLGMADRATQKKYAARCARNCQVTITEVLKSPRGRRDLARKAVRNRLAFLHSWAAAALLDDGDYAGARGEFLKSLHYRLWQPGRWKLYVLTCLPGGISQWARRWYRNLKGAVGARPASELRS